MLSCNDTGLKRFFIGALAVMVLAALLAACNTGETSQEDIIAVRKVIEQRAIAIREKNLDKLRSLFVDDYFDGKYRVDDIVNELSAAYSQYPSIELTQQKSPVEVKMNTARVVQRIVYDGQGFAKPLHGQEILYLRRINNEWKISNGVAVGVLPGN